MSGSNSRARELADLAAFFLRLGVTAFGGPAAHIAIMREETVRRRRWLTDEEFLRLLAASNLIPGPSSTELAIHIGRERAGWRGLLVAGGAFILPAAVITSGLAWAYRRFGAVPAVRRVAGSRAERPPGDRSGGAAIGALAAGKAVSGAAGVTLLKPLLVFAKIGAVLCGSGYVLFAFLRADLVERLHWLTESQLLDAVVVGQVTPGPVFTTATFIGYILAGPRGAAVATAGIFLPAFVLVALSGLLLPLVQRSRASIPFLDGVSAASVALILVVTVQLVRGAIVDWPTAAILIAGAALLARYRINPSWLVLGGATAGVIARAVA